MATKNIFIRSIRVRYFALFFVLFCSQSSFFSQSRNENCDSLIEIEHLEFEISTISGSSESLLPGKTRNLTCDEIKLILASRKEDESIVIQLDRYTEVLIFKKNK